MGQVFVGIDVAKAAVEVCVRPTGEAFAVPRDEVGLARLVERLTALGPALVVLEATGGYEASVAAALAGGGLAGSSSIRGKRGTSPAARGSSRRPIGSTPGCWPNLPTPFGHPYGRCRPRQPKSWARWSGGGGSSST